MIKTTEFHVSLLRLYYRKSYSVLFSFVYYTHTHPYWGFKTDCHVDVWVCVKVLKFCDYIKQKWKRKLALAWPLYKGIMYYTFSLIVFSHWYDIFYMYTLILSISWTLWKFVTPFHYNLAIRRRLNYTMYIYTILRTADSFLLWISHNVVAVWRRNATSLCWI